MHKLVLVAMGILLGVLLTVHISFKVIELECQQTNKYVRTGKYILPSISINCSVRTDHVEKQK
jgi:hypothetical protein